MPKLKNKNPMYWPLILSILITAWITFISFFTENPFFNIMLLYIGLVIVYYLTDWWCNGGRK